MSDDDHDRPDRRRRRYLDAFERVREGAAGRDRPADRAGCARRPSRASPSWASPTAQRGLAVHQPRAAARSAVPAAAPARLPRSDPRPLHVRRRRHRLVFVNGHSPRAVDAARCRPACSSAAWPRRCSTRRPGRAAPRPVRRLRGPRLRRAEHRLPRATAPSSTCPTGVVVEQPIASAVSSRRATASRTCAHRRAPDRRRARAARRPSSRRYAGADGDAYFTNAVTEIVLGDERRRRSLQAAGESPRRRSTSPRTQVVVGRDSQLLARTTSASAARWSATRSASASTARTARRPSTASTSARGTQHIDNHTRHRPRQAALRQPRAVQGHPRRQGAAASSTARSSSARTPRRPTPSRPTRRCCCPTTRPSTPSRSWRSSPTTSSARTARPSASSTSEQLFYLRARGIGAGAGPRPADLRLRQRHRRPHQGRRRCASRLERRSAGSQPPAAGCEVEDE